MLSDLRDFDKMVAMTPFDELEKVHQQLADEIAVRETVEVVTDFFNNASPQQIGLFKKRLGAGRGGAFDGN